METGENRRNLRTDVRSCTTTRPERWGLITGPSTRATPAQHAPIPLCMHGAQESNPQHLVQVAHTTIGRASMAASGAALKV